MSVLRRAWRVLAALFRTSRPRDEVLQTSRPDRPDGW